VNLGWLSASPAARTGYGTQTMEICDRLLDRHSVTCIGQTGSMMVWGGRQEIPTPTGKTLVTLPLIEPAVEVINKYYINEFNLDVIVGFMDAFGIEYMNRLDVPVIGWFPIDGPFTEKWAHYVRDFYKICTYSRFGYNELVKFFPRSRIDYIPHSIPDVFKPRDPKIVRSEFEESHGIPEDSFLVLTTGANVGPRKELPLMMKTFSRFVKEGNEDAHLYLHTNPNQTFPRGYDLLQWRTMLGMERHIHFPFKDPVFNPVTNEYLSEMCSAADLYWQNSVGEGFGLPIGEAMACGTPVMIPDNSSQSEFLNFDTEEGKVSTFGCVHERGILFDCLMEEVYEQIPVYVPQLPNYPVPDQISALGSLSYMKRHRDELPEMGKKAEAFINKYHRIDSIIDDWFRLLAQVEEELNMFKALKKTMLPLEF